MKIITYKNRPASQKERSVIENYKLSSMCITQKVENGILLCHTATGALVLLSNEEYKTVCSGEPLHEAWCMEFAALGFLPDAAEDEFASIDRQRMQTHTDSASAEAITAYTILPTSRCNARCFYCYEEGIAQKNMSQKTALDTAAFIANHCQGQKVHISWFGGEPTAAHPTITLISQQLQERNVKFSSSMISNGLLLTEDLIRTAVELWNLRHVQITIDGTRSVYNATKNYRDNVEDPYSVVLYNIKRLLENKIRVSIRINLGLHNFEDVSVLIRELNSIFAGQKGITVYVHEIDNYYSDEEYAELMTKTLELNTELVDQKMQNMPELPVFRLHSCMADNDNSVMINPDGQLGKCEHYVFDKLHGSIYSNETDTELIAQWKEPVRFEQCSSCVFYASCLRLNWCNGGGYFCRSGVIDNKLRQTRDTMLRIYNTWILRRSNFLQTDIFQVCGMYRTEQINNELCAILPLANNSEKTVTLPVNQTALDILDILQTPHTLPEIVDMLEEKYDTSGFDLSEIVEDYLLSIVDCGACTCTSQCTERTLPTE